MRHSLLALAILVVPTIAFAQNQPPVANAGGDQAMYTGDCLTLNGTAYDPDGEPIVLWSWFVDVAPAGATWNLYHADLPAAVFCANDPGQYLISFLVVDSSAGSVPDVIAVTVADNMAPVAVAVADVTEGPAPLTVRFDGSQSYDPEGRPLASYLWEFGDGSAPYVGATPPPHVYAVPGVQRVVTLTVTDERGANDSDILVIAVTVPVNHPPVASPSATPTSGQAPLAVHFAANATDADHDPLTYSWDFGDSLSPANSSTAAEPGHVYASAGTYVAWLTVSDGKAPVTYSLTLVVSPELAFSVASASVKWTKKDTLGNVDVVADFAAPLPAADDAVMMTLDGVSLVVVPFSALGLDAGSGAYTWQDKQVSLSIDFGAGTLSVHRTKTVMVGFNPANGVDVHLTLGDLDAVENIAMTPTHGDRLVYQRSGAQ